MDSEHKKIGKEIIKVSNIIKRKGEKIIISNNTNEIDKVTFANSFIIRYLICNDDKNIYQKDIENEFCLARSTISKVLSLMEEKGIIKREGVSNDARLKKITPTQKAYEIHNIIIKSMNKLEDKLTEIITDEEQRQLFTILEKISSDLND